MKYKKQLFLQYIIYLFRWQLSTPILAILVFLLTSTCGALATTIIANLVGGLIFFWIDKKIFNNKISFPIWQVRENIICFNCNQKKRGYRLVHSKNYNAENKIPKFLCEKCSADKTKKLEKQGIEI